MQMGALSQVYIARRLKFLGHILRHQDSLEHDVVFTNVGNFRCLDAQVTPMREGRPKAHWPEMSIVQAYNRLQISKQPTPLPSYTDYNHIYFHTPTMEEVWRTLGNSSLHFAAHTAHYTQPLRVVAADRTDWRSRVGR